MPAPISTTLKLPYGYSVDLTMDPEKGFSFDWKPAYPKFENERVKRKFWSGYFKSRDEFLQGCADTWRMVVPLNAQDGLKFFRPNVGVEILNLKADKFALHIHYMGERALTHIRAADIPGMIETVDKWATEHAYVAERVAAELMEGKHTSGGELSRFFVACLLWLCTKGDENGADLMRRASEGGFYLGCHLFLENGGLRTVFDSGVESMDIILDKVAEARKQS
jgi:hypothetical protein